MMKATKLFYSALATCLLCGIISSCSDEESDKTGIAIENFEAFINFDLSARTGWKLYFGGEEYYYTVEKEKLIATSPKDKPFRFDYGQEKGEAILHLRSTDYGKTRDEAVVPIIEDQSTIRKFTNCDPLRATYRGTAIGDLPAIQLYHYNALLAFNIEELPERAEVWVVTGNPYYQTIKPLRDEADKTAYKAIVLPNTGIERISIAVKIDGRTYQTSLKQPESRMPSYPDGIGGSAIVSFTAHIDENDKLVLENFNRKTSSKEWPISQ